MPTNIRDKVLKLVEGVVPGDELERTQREDAILWIKSGAELFRVRKPDVPPKHLVSYFILFDPDADRFLLVDHIKAQLWLPAGGHVELNEHPRATAEREVMEELGIPAEFFFDGIFFLTQAVTVGLTAGHTDVSLWYVLRGDSRMPLRYDSGEFNGYQWFSPDEILAMPIETLDPHLHRFVKKWRDQRAV